MMRRLTCGADFSLALLTSRSMHLIVFFSYGISMQEWEKSGLLSREIKLYQGLSNYGIKTTFLTYGDRSDIQCLRDYPDLEVLPIYSRMGRSKFKWIRIFQSLLSPFLFYKELVSASVLKTNQVWGGWIGIVAKISSGKKLIVRGGYEPYTFLSEGRSHWAKRLSLFGICWFTYRLADYVEMATKEDMHTVNKKFRVPAPKIRIRANVVDTNLFKPATGERIENSILMVGRLDWQKNYPLAFEALEGTEIAVTIVGDGDQRRALSEYATTLGVEVNFVGRVRNDELPELFNGHSIYVLSSHFEGNPKTLLEAMACGLAVIGTDVTGIKTVIRDGQNGLLARPDATSLRAGILRLHGSRYLRSQLGTRARRDVTINHSLEKRIIDERDFLYSLTRNA